jgi:hypothetical protein
VRFHQPLRTATGEPGDQQDQRAAGWGRSTTWSDGRRAQVASTAPPPPPPTRRSQSTPSRHWERSPPARTEFASENPPRQTGAGGSSAGSATAPNFSKPPIVVKITSGTQVSCTFTNVFIPKGSISLAKITKGATGKVNFQVEPVSGTPAQFLQTATTTSEGVPAGATPNTPADATDHLRLGSYRITEQAPASEAGHWTLTQVECNGELVPFDQGTAEVTLTRSKPDVRCVYTDTFTRTIPPEPPPEPPAPLPPDPLVPPGPPSPRSAERTLGGPRRHQDGLAGDRQRGRRRQLPDHGDQPGPRRRHASGGQ